MENLPSLAKRIATEIAVAKEVFDEIDNPTVCIFGGARVKPGSKFYQQAEDVGYALASNGFAVVTGGGPGIMEAGNKGAARAEDGISIGLNIILPFEQKGNEYQNVSLDFNHFASRKIMFCRNAKAFIFCAGGVGTLDELGEVLTLIQCKKHESVPVILYDSKFWLPFIDWLRDTVVANGLASIEDVNNIKIVDTPEEVLDILK